MQKHRTRFIALCALACATGCAAKDTHYLLTADGPAPSGAVARRAIGLGPVSIPDYVDRPELVFQRGANRFEVPANHRWTGSLEENVTGVLAANLARRVSGVAVRGHPWPGAAPAVTIAVDIQRFHAVSGGDAVLEATWHVSGRAARTHHGAFQEPLRRDGYDAMVAAQSRLLAMLADAIAASLESG